MVRRIHSIVLLLALLVGGVGMNYVQAANVTLTLTASPAKGGRVKLPSGTWSTATNGTVSQTVVTSKSLPIQAEAFTGYTFSQWSDGNKNATRAVQLTSNKTYTATFIPNKVTITATCNSSQGTVKINSGTAGASVSASVDYNSTVTLTATPKAGYHFVKWSDNSTSATRQFTATANATYTATFAINTYTITFKNEDGTTLKTQTVNHGVTPTAPSTPTKSATAQYTYTFKAWSPTIAAATKDQTYTATYTATVRSYTIRFMNGNTALQTNTLKYGATPNYTGSTPTKASTAQYSYTFNGWSPAIYAVNKAQDYTAQFTSTTRSYKITGASSNTTMGTVSGTATKQYGQTVTLTATPKDCYKFVQWNDGTTTNPRTVTVTGAKTYTATFEETISGNCGANGDNVKWYLNECTGVLRIVGSGAMADYTSSNPGWYSYRSSITSVTIASGVTSIGAYAFWNLTALTSVVIPSTVTSIGKRAFGNCNLSSLTIPNGVTSIQEGLCYHCSSLTSVTIPNSVTDIGNNAFYATSLVSVTIPNAVTSIGSYAFSTNNAITDIYVSWTTASAIPIWYSMTNKTASEITLHIPCGSGDLYRAANGWKNYTIRGDTQYTLTAKTPGSGYGTVSIDDGTAGVSVSQKIYCETDHRLRPIRTGCYYFTQWSDGNTDNPRTVRINSNAAYNAQFSNTFSGTCGATGNEANVQWSLNTCTGVLSITGTGDMKDNSTNQPWYPYRESITSVTIANGVTRIGYFAFNSCSNLTTVTIPPSVTFIDDYAFSGCYAMESLYITDLAAWCNISFGGSAASPFYRNVYSNHLGGGNLYVNGTKVTTLTIPDGITAIPAYAFYGFAGITDIQFNQTKTIGSYAFCGCHGLTHVTIPEGVTAIFNNSFAYCTHLQSMSIPASVTSIGNEMMSNCQAQTDLYVHWTENVPAWPSSFTSKSPQTDITLHVPTCKQLLYTGGWANYTIDAETEERTVSFASNNATYGLVQYEEETPVASIEKQIPCTTSFVVKAIPAEGCHFVEWSDGLLQGTRQLGNLGSDTALIALFGPGVPPEIYDDQVGSTQQGALSGAFSVSETQVVYFSQGPLQFNASLGTHECADGTSKPGTWRFAEHQYDVVGDLYRGNVYENGVKCSNTLASATYTGWQDMYCWGASGYNGIEPYKANRPSTTSIAGTNYDWGVYNAISNGGNTPGLWRTPTRTEWDYMFNMRPNAKQLNAPAMVEGMYGLVVLPDDYWDAPAGINLVTNSTQYYTDNVFTAEQWEQLEAAGAVFIPSGGWFSWSSNTWVSYFANTGELWASTGSSTSTQHDVQWGNNKQAYMSSSSTHVLQQLRLVSDVGGYAQVRFVGTDSHGDKFVIAYIYVPYGATPVPPEVPERECYTFAGWDRTITPVAGHVTTYTAQYEDLIYSGTCGADGDNLTWTLNACDSTLIISGTGAMANYPANMPWKDYRTSIISVIISEGVTTIGAHAFNGCSHLTSLTVPSSLTSIGQNAFTDCWAMESVYISDLEAWCNIDFGTYDSSPFSRNGYLNYVGGGDLYVNDTKVTTLTIPDGITEIKHHAFYGFAGITSIDFNQVTSIGNEAFNGCHGLSEVTIPEGVTAIGNVGFAYCTHLQSISIPASASSLGTSMLAADNMLTDIHVHWTENIPAWPENFTKKNPQSSITLHIPCGAEELYSAADGWNGYTLEGEGGPYTITVTTDDASMGSVAITVP